jgi:hypothetical protein
MSGGEAAEVIVILAVFLGGVVCGFLVIVSRTIKREDKKHSLREVPSDAVARGTRIVTGVGSRDVREHSP